MSSNNIFGGEIDPSIANLLGDDTSGGDDEAPDFDSLFNEGNKSSVEALAEDADSIKEEFTAIQKFEEAPKPFFNDKAYYNKLMKGEGDVSKRLHAILAKFMKADNPGDKSMYRGRLLPAYWDFLRSIARHIGPGMEQSKRLCLRFGVLLPNLIGPDQRKMLSKIIMKNTSGEPVYYTDEWLSLVGSGNVNSSVVDETKKVKKKKTNKLGDKANRLKSEKKNSMMMLKNKTQKFLAMEQDLVQKVNSLTQHNQKTGMDGLVDLYTQEQRQSLSTIAETTKALSRLDKEIASGFESLHDVDNQLTDVQDKVGDTDDYGEVDDQSIISEFNTIRQMSKMCVGRQGNHFPFLMKQYFRANLKEIGTRENVITQMAYVEKVDPNVFKRTFKQQTNRIVPYVVILPNFGDIGICWEPFERFNRATSRGRIAIPMFPKDLRTAIISALADIRWQVAKEKAQHYWMEEGLTGRYYQWFTDKKMRGDVRDAFIQDYILWVTKEYEGTQKLDREVRGIFWRNIPFPQETKDKLKNRGFVYNELYKKDINRSLTDGY